MAKQKLYQGDPPSVVAAIRRLIAHGLTREQIADEVGCHRSSIGKYLDETRSRVPWDTGYRIMGLCERVCR